MREVSKKEIEEVILKNYIEYQYLFVEFQSKFLTGLNHRYQGLDNGNLVLYYARQIHQDILRKKDYDLNFNISFEKFWENHRETNPQRISIINIGKYTFLPKETARRKILYLIKKKVLNKKNKSISWMPSNQYKKNYNLFINVEIDGICQLISFISEKINLSVPREKLKYEIKNNFSFYWFNYLEVQLEYLKIWSKRLGDLELGLIFLQVAHLFTSKAKEKNLSHKELYDKPVLFKEFISASISATSIAEVTGIPRATCVRKLEFLVKLKAISQDKISKRYYIIPSVTSDDLISRKITNEVVRSFSNFFFICLRAVNAKTLNQ